jgi:NADH:ubiquinone oxidoreductase subunit K
VNFLTILLVPFLIFLIGLTGILLNRKNFLLVIVCIELILLSINFSYLLISFYLDDILGQIFAIFILTVAGAETSIGLAIFIVYYRI